MKTKAMEKAIDKYTKKRIPLQTLYEMFETIIEGTDLAKHTLEFEAAFQLALDRLVNQNIIKPVKSSKMNHRGLYLKYVKPAPLIDNNEIHGEIINTIIKPMDIKYYLSNPMKYLEDKEYILALVDFFKSTDKIWVTVNERSYELFNDEKFLKGNERNRSYGEAILGRLGLTYCDLYCTTTLEPFFCFLKGDLSSKANRKVYIIENKDTFWSMKYAAFDDGGLDVDMLIYGEGRKIISSFQFIGEYGLDEKDKFIYFGDLDSEGIIILDELIQRYNKYNIKPYILGYEQLIASAKSKGTTLVPKAQSLNKKALDNFLGYFCKDSAASIYDIIVAGRYVPQEAFSLKKMKQLFEKILSINAEQE